MCGLRTNDTREPGLALTEQPDSEPPAAVARCRLPGEALQETGTVQLNEPAESDSDALLARLRDNTYDKPFVIDDGRVRRLYFGLAYVQSEMSIARPHELNFAYTRKMMGFLLFVPRPKHVLIVGLGGGSLTRFCHRQLPRARVTTVEIDPEVIAFGDLFELPAQDRRHALIRADAVDYFAATTERPDVVLLDGCDSQGLAPGLCNAAFFHNVRERLKPRGVLVINLVGAAAALRATLAIVDEVFAGRVIVQNVSEGGTRVAFAFQDSTYAPDWDGLLRQARELARKHALDFPALARKLRRSGMNAPLRRS
jgi:spermidine synthase